MLRLFISPKERLGRNILLAKVITFIVVVGSSLAAWYYKTWYIAAVMPLLALVYFALLGLGSTSKALTTLRSMAEEYSMYHTDEILFQKSATGSFVAFIRTVWAIMLWVASCVSVMILIDHFRLFSRLFDRLLIKSISIFNGLFSTHYQLQLHHHPYLVMASKIALSGTIMIILVRIVYISARKIRLSFDSALVTAIAGHSWSY